jgi:hypothetical protein
MKITLDSEEVSARIGGRTAQRIWARVRADSAPLIDEQTTRLVRLFVSGIRDVGWTQVILAAEAIAAQAREDYDE